MEALHVGASSRSSMPPFARALLWVDSLGGLLAATGVAIFREQLADLEVQSLARLWFLVGANLAYGCYSGVLALKSRTILPRVAVDLLIAANLTWTLVCWVLAWKTSSTASLFGTAHLVGEGVYVGLLGLFERRFVRPTCR